MLHNVGNNRDCDVDVDHRNNTNVYVCVCTSMCTCVGLCVRPCVCMCVELFDMKTRYEESDNMLVRATRTVTDKMSELFGMLSDLVTHWHCNSQPQLTSMQRGTFWPLHNQSVDIESIS